MEINTSTSGLVPVGTIVAYYGNEQSIPKGWFLCNGRQMTQNEIDQYPNLANLLSSTNYYLPNLGGLTIVGSGSQGNGEPVYASGQKGGTTEVTLSLEEIPAHTHNLIYFQAEPQGGGTSNAARLNVSDADKPATTTSTGGMADGTTKPHDNMQPYCVLSYIMCAGL